MKLIKQTDNRYLAPISRFKSPKTLALAAIILASGAATDTYAQRAEEEEQMEELETKEEVEMAEKSDGKFVSGNITVAVNTHFISYGFDVWGTGGHWDNLSFNPMIDFSFDIGNGFSIPVGVWADVNDNAPSNIGSGSAVQEIDVWAGLAYSYEKWSFTVLYQSWNYAGQEERIIDGIVGYDHWLNPSLTIHGRVSNAILGPGLASDELNGVVGVLGVAPGKDFGDVSVSVPLNVGFSTADFHDYNDVGTDAGLAFFNVGVGASYPLKFMPGDWSVNGGVTYWYTPEDTVPTNPEESFITGSFSLALAF